MIATSVLNRSTVYSVIVLGRETVAMLGGVGTERQLMDGAAKDSLRKSSKLALQRFGSDALDTYVLRYVGILAAFTAMLPAWDSTVRLYGSVR